MRILLVEDEIRLGENVAAAFRDGPGFEVEHVQDGETAIGLTSVKCYDLIILDLNLPKLDGHGVLRELRKRGDKTAVLVVSAHSEPQTIVSLFKAGADDYLCKPFDLGELIARATFLNGRVNFK